MKKQFRLPELDPSARCPCGSSDKPLTQCCLRSDGRLYRSPPRVTPPPPCTAYSHQGCYLKGLGDCSRNISREHYVSRDVLNVLQTTGQVGIAGMPWLASNENQTVGIEALTAKILCARH